MSIFSRKKSSPKGNEPPPEKTEAPEKQATIPARSIGSEVISLPLLTEKATGLATGNQYVFVVSKKATKPEIKKEIEQLFGVKVERIAVINEKAKQRVWRGRKGWRTGYKKAIVTIEKGKKIEILPT